MEENMGEDFQEDPTQGWRNEESQGSPEGWQDEDLYFEEEEETKNDGFASAVQSVFPNGITNISNNNQRLLGGDSNQEAHTVTPHANRQTVTTRSPIRGGRGGMGGNQYTHIKSRATSMSKNGVSNFRPEETPRELEILDTGGILPGNDFRRAKLMIQGEADQVFKLLPEQEQPELSSLQTFTYMAELQFNKPLSAKGLKMENSKEFNVPICLGQWIKRTREFNPDLIVLPYREEEGKNPLTHEEQLPQDDSDAIDTYFRNHRVENNGILKGMVRFSITVPWMKLKDTRSSYFKWLSNNRIYLRHNSFDSDTMVLLGFLLGAHPDAARLLDLTNELTERLNLPDKIHFQLSIRNLTAIHSTATGNKFGFKAIAIETDGRMASAVREALFRLSDPKVEKHRWPVTGSYLFIPMFKTESWTPESISAMAKLHVKIVSKLEQVFIMNVYDIDTVVTFTVPGGKETRKTLREAIQASFNNTTNENVVHSAHTTNRSGILRILVTKENAVAVKAFFGTLQDHLPSSLSVEDMYLITQGKMIQVTDRTFKSNDSKISAGYAATLLRENPQDGEPVAKDGEVVSPQRKKSRMEVSYSTVAKRAIEPTRRRNHTDAHLAGDEDEPANGEGEGGEDFWEQQI
eukprot:CAMPEP_0172436854 /NCGR_PEP_ID=MMETSP1064-20121228/71944_1 /TAXON_ID=202472 /ORGANISM="Aulacoseira subarctica , Strain CCAP 1002/5" /LENGTH=632 /DNA_ID=CAMNT_0013185283 /DNA_START=74 /DNA_END=1972 /DNA_ORIENTATION=+